MKGQEAQSWLVVGGVALAAYVLYKAYGVAGDAASKLSGIVEGLSDGIADAGGAVVDTVENLAYAAGAAYAETAGSLIGRPVLNPVSAVDPDNMTAADAQNQMRAVDNWYEERDRQITLYPDVYDQGIYVTTGVSP